jgi:hypothetical protein
LEKEVSIHIAANKNEPKASVLALLIIKIKIIAERSRE